MEYFTKHDENPYADLYWNLPEQKRGSVNVIGGHPQNFRNTLQTAEYLSKSYPIETVTLVLPASLQKTLPPLPSTRFLPATDAGSFSGENLPETLDSSDYNLLTGDFSKNTITATALMAALAKTSQPTLLTRDTLDLLADHQPEPTLGNPNLNLFGSLVQLKKLLDSLYYPKRLLLSQSLLQVAETLHKFTLSYPIGLVTLHNDQILAAKDGTVEATALAHSPFSPLTLWRGEFASRLLALNLYNPNNFVQASIAAVYQNS